MTKSAAEVLQMTPEELNKYNEEKVQNIFNMIIKGCETLKERFMELPTESSERANIMTISLAFSNLLSDENIEKEIKKIKKHIIGFKKQMKMHIIN